MTEASRADFSHLLSDSWEMSLDAGGVEVKPDWRDIRLKQLLIFEDSVHQPETAAGSALWSVARPYHLDCDFAVLRKWSINRPPASELREGYPSTKVKFIFAIFLHSQSSVGIWMDTLPGVTALGPENGLSSDPVLALSSSGMSDQPMYSRMPFIVSLYVCSSEGTSSGSAVQSGSSESSPSSV